MSSNYIQPGDVMEFTAPAGGVTKGVLVLIGGLPVIPTDTVAAGTTFRGKVSGVWTLLKTAGETWLETQPIFWDAANGKASNDPTVGQLPIGQVAGGGALVGDASGPVRLNGVSLSGRTFNVRKRFLIASVNAGATLLPAIAGAKYRMVGAHAIAVGGAVTTVTTVDILATLAAASRKLVAFAQASLTQSTKLTDGGAGAAILADGASYTPNDAGAAVTVNITGAAITVATNVDFSFTYAIE